MEKQKLLMRVVINKDDIRKLVLNETPNSVEELKAHIKEKLSLQYDFILQYEDKDFDNALCNLTHITDLPEKATLKVIPLVTLELSAVRSPGTSSDAGCSSTDTDILPPTETPLRRQWPESFDIPNFSVDVEYRLTQADHAFMKDGTRMSLSRDMKHDILEKLAEAMYSFKAYPDDDDYTSVAQSLISKHPSLAEPGSQPGYYGWKNSLKFKMGNYRTKLRRAGCEDVRVNGGKRSKNNPEGESSRKNIKRPKRGEANYLPNLPDRQNEEGLESARLVLVEEMKKKQPNVSLVSNLMDQTFSLRRQEIVKKEPAVQDIVERWPALFTEGQVFAEFSRIATKHLESSFFESLDKHTPRIIELLQSKKGAVGQKIQELMATLSSDVTGRRSMVLKGLPIIFGDDPNKLYKTCFETTKDEAIDNVTVGVLTIQAEDDPEQSVSTAIILEGGIVMDKIRDLPQAVCLIFGLTYALNLDYPKCVGYTFKFIQSVMLGLGNKTLPPKLLTVKNLLFDE